MTLLESLLMSKSVHEAAVMLNLKDNAFLVRAKFDGTIEQLRDKIHIKEKEIKEFSHEWENSKLKVEQYQLNQLCKKMAQLGENW